MNGNKSITESLTLTPNLPLAQQLRRKRLIESGLRAAPSAPVEQLQQWLNQSIKPELPLATDAQLQLIWEQVIADYRDRNDQFSQLNPGLLAGRALTAWQSLKRWQIPLDELRQAETGQLIHFSDWVQQFEKRLKQLGLSSLDLEITRQLGNPSENLVTKQPKACLYAFILPPAPLYMSWLEYYFEEVTATDFQATDSQAVLTARDKPELELDAALQWAADKLAQNPGERIAIVDFDLGKHLKMTQRLASAYLPENARVCFNRALPLTEEGPVQTALALLQLNGQHIDLATARLIAQSRLWGEFEPEYDQRADWDKAICALKQKQLEVVQLSQLLNDNGIKGRLSTAFSDKRQIKQLSPLQWAGRFQRQLDALGVLAATDGYDWSRWALALDEFSALGGITGDIDCAEAQRLISRIAKRPRAQSHPDGPGLYLLDTIEAAADFKRLWVMGMNSQNWPGAPQPNPLLPVQLQVRYQMPHANAEQEANLAAQLIDRVRQVADEVIFSYAQLQDDLEQSPSALVSDLPRLPTTETVQRAFLPASMQWLDCSLAPGVAEDQCRISGYGGGAALLRTMAASPFDAFATWRLKAEPLEQPQIGLSAADRGNLVHQVLDQLWAQLQDSASLQASTIEELEALCQQHAGQALQPFLKRFGHHFIRLETKRIARLIFDWLMLERERPTFFVELAEQALDARIGPLNFRLRLDRLDRTAAGKLILIDYKTGTSLKRSYWLDMPPEEPQLPLYALTLPSAPDALCFARVRADKMEFIGIGREQLMPGIEAREDWATLLGQWQESLESLALAYVQGDARVVETDTIFGQTDPLASLHRFAEKDQLDSLRNQFVEVGE